MIKYYTFNIVNNKIKQCIDSKTLESETCVIIGCFNYTSSLIGFIPFF